MLAVVNMLHIVRCAYLSEIQYIGMCIWTFLKFVHFKILKDVLTFSTKMVHPYISVMLYGNQ